MKYKYKYRMHQVEDGDEDNEDIDSDGLGEKVEGETDQEKAFKELNMEDYDDEPDLNRE